MRFRLDKIDWKALSEDKRLKFNIGLAVALIIFFAFFIDIIFSINRFKYYIEEKPREKKTVKERIKAPKKIVAKVAIILDDAGGTIPDYDNICSIRQPLTVSVLPHLLTSGSVAGKLNEAGFEIMLHLPMEPENGAFVRRDGGMVLCSSSDEETRKTVLNDFDSVKLAAGFNNHLGSKATKDEKVMKAVLGSVRGKGFYFIDSRTSGSSLACRIARSFHIPSAENNVFLDGGTKEADIESKFKYLISVAKLRGQAIGIGHATRQTTINVLKRLMPLYAGNGIKFVYASEMVK